MAHGAINAVFPVESILVSLLYSLLLSFSRRSPPLTEIMPKKLEKHEFLRTAKKLT